MDINYDGAVVRELGTDVYLDVVRIAAPDNEECDECGATARWSLSNFDGAWLMCTAHMQQFVVALPGS